ncbi:MFS transporter [Demequina salsinemoris]|uniref:MFS transporter n=1 Tax=Demequina salsinemoris TaxID=577470 RepID=UPI000780F00B|nr:MFS transporter [Demequina salsinemoris]
MTAAFAILVGFLLSNMPSPVYPVWQDQMGFSASTTTVLFAVYQAGVLVGLVGIGRLSDRIGWRPMLAGSMATTAAAALMFAVAPGPAWLLAARALSGLSVGVVASCGSAAVTAEQERRGRDNGPLIASVVTSMGLAFGPLLGGIGVDLNPNPAQSAFVLEFAFALLMVVFIVSGMRTLAIASSPRATAAEEVGLEDIGGVRTPARAMLTAATPIATAGIVCAIYMSVGSGFIRDALDVTSGTVGGLLVFVVFASAFTGQLVFRAVEPGVQGMVSMGASIGAAILLVAGLVVGSVAVLFVSAALSGVSQGLAQTAGYTIARRVNPLVRLRGAYAWLNFASYLFGGGFVLLTGVLLTGLSLVAVTVTVGTLVCLMAVVGIGMLVRNRDEIAVREVVAATQVAATMEPQPDRG